MNVHFNFAAHHRKKIMETCRIMLDIETLGTRPGSKILSIGAVKFDLEHEVFTDSYSLKISRDDKRFVEDPDTLQWWDKQDPFTKRMTFGGTTSYELSLEVFNKWITRVTENYKTREFWCKGASFDFPLLEFAYRITGVPVPWKYCEQRCLRTLIKVHKNIPLPPPTGTAHIAIDDALYQAKQCATILRTIY